MIHQAKSNPQLLDEQIFSERSHPLFLLLAHRDILRRRAILVAFGVEADINS